MVSVEEGVDKYAAIDGGYVMYELLVAPELESSDRVMPEAACSAQLLAFLICAICLLSMPISGRTIPWTSVASIVDATVLITSISYRSVIHRQGLVASNAQSDIWTRLSWLRYVRGIRLPLSCTSHSTSNEVLSPL